MNRRDFLKCSALIVAAPAIVRYDSLMRPVPWNKPVLGSTSMEITLDQMRYLRQRLVENEILPGADGTYTLVVGRKELIAPHEWSERVKAEIRNNWRLS